MFVKKYEADTLEAALKEIKLELGPDAIILKTITNKGLKGALKKKKIEITAAITEKSYVRKSTAEKSLTQEQKVNFYQSSSENIANKIDNYSDNVSSNSKLGYGQLGLNKIVKKAHDKIKSELDDFLGDQNSISHRDNGQVFKNKIDVKGFDDDSDDLKKRSIDMPYHTSNIDKTSADDSKGKNLKNNSYSELDITDYDTNQNSFQYQDSRSTRPQQLHEDLIFEKINILENKIEFLEAKNHDSDQYESSDNVNILSKTLRSFDLSSNVVKKIVSKAQFELNEEQLSDDDTLFDFAIRELSGMINTELPLFSKVDTSTKAVTILLSDVPVGKTSTLVKMASMRDRPKLIIMSEENECKSYEVYSKIFDLDIIIIDSLKSLAYEIKKAQEQDKEVLVELNHRSENLDETKGFLSSIKRGFDNVEVLICLSSIHNETYNKKVMHKYQNACDGVIYTFLDECLSFGEIINTHLSFSKCPLKFFTTGKNIPKDIQVAKGEYLLNKLFNI